MARAKNKNGFERGDKLIAAVRLMSRKKGVTKQELMEKLDWKSGMVYVFVCEYQKYGKGEIESFKDGAGNRRYRIAA